MTDEYQRRSAVRALLVAEPEQRVLLIRMHVPDTDRMIWLAPGGGIEPGESEHDALTREVQEETGLRAFSTAGPVWTRRMKFTLHDQRIDQSEIYYLIRTTLFEPDNSGNPAQLERSTFREFRWWSLSEISAAEDEIFVPLSFAEHFAHLLAEGVPAAPYDVGR